MRPGGRWGAGLLATVIVGVPGTAWACPSCATREGPGLEILLAVGAIILTPYVIAVVALHAIRRFDRTG